LDVLLSKLNMIHESKPIEQTSFAFQTSQKDHELREAIIEIQKVLNLEEGKILKQFKNLHGLMKKDMMSTNVQAASESEQFLS
jgi:hypothetical protein